MAGWLLHFVPFGFPFARGSANQGMKTLPCALGAQVHAQEDEQTSRLRKPRRQHCFSWPICVTQSESVALGLGRNGGAALTLNYIPPSPGLPTPTPLPSSLGNPTNAAALFTVRPVRPALPGLTEPRANLDSTASTTAQGWARLTPASSASMPGGFSLFSPSSLGTLQSPAPWCPPPPLGWVSSPQPESLLESLPTPALLYLLCSYDKHVKTKWGKKESSLRGRNSFSWVP